MSGYTVQPTNTKHVASGHGIFSRLLSGQGSSYDATNEYHSHAVMAGLNQRGYDAVVSSTAAQPPQLQQVGSNAALAADVVPVRVNNVGVFASMDNRADLNNFYRAVGHDAHEDFERRKFATESAKMFAAGKALDEQNVLRAQKSAAAAAAEPAVSFEAPGAGAGDALYHRALASIANISDFGNPETVAGNITAVTHGWKSESRRSDNTTLEEFIRKNAAWLAENEKGVSLTVIGNPLSAEKTSRSNNGFAGRTTTAFPAPSTEYATPSRRASQLPPASRTDAAASSISANASNWYKQTSAEPRVGEPLAVQSETRKCSEKVVVDGKTVCRECYMDPEKMVRLFKSVAAAAEDD